MLEEQSNRIRPMRTEDIEQAGEIWKEAYPIAKPSVSQGFLLSRHDEMIKKDLPKAVKSSNGYVYEVDGQVVGFLTFLPMRRSYIDNIYVKALYRGQKIVGPALLRFAQNLQNFLTTDVHQENIKGINFYEKGGFVKLCNRTSPEGDKKFRMEWNKEKSKNRLTKILKPVFLGIVDFIGVVTLVVGVYGTAFNLYNYLFEHDLYMIGLFLSPVLAVVGIGIVYAGTTYLNRAKSFLENAWLLGIMIVGLGIFSFCYRLVTNVLTYEILELTLDVTLVIIGCLFVWASRKKSKVKIKTGE